MTLFHIPADNGMLLFALFLGLVLTGVALERHGPFKGLPAPAFIFIVAAGLAHLGLLPRESAFHGFIWTILVPLGIALFLIRADLVSIFRSGGRVLVAFLMGTVGVVLGTLLAVILVDTGPQEARLAAVFSATYIGGSMNFAAVSEAIGFEDRALLASALAIDNIMGTGCMLVLMYAATRRRLALRFHWRGETLSATAAGAPAAGRPASLIGLLTVLGLAALVTALADIVMRALGAPSYGILGITVLMVLIATLARRPLANVGGEDILAMICMYLFIAMVGTGLDLSALTGEAGGLFLMVGIIFAVHLGVLFTAGYFFKFNHGELITASLACITGPAVVAALAIAFGWSRLIGPGVLTGILGYAIGNFISIALFFYLS